MARRGSGCVYSLSGGSIGMGLGIALPSAALAIAGWAIWESASEPTGDAEMIFQLAQLSVGFVLGMGAAAGGLIAVGLLLVGLLVSCLPAFLPSTR